MFERFKIFFKSISQTKLAFLILGIGSTVWFLIRVIPKPSRAGYPCMRAAAPLMSGFVIYLLALGGSVLLFKRTWSKIKQAQYLAASVTFIGFVLVVLAVNFKDVKQAYATANLVNGELPDGVNNPMGVGFGIFPGRVVWEWNTAATNEKCLNTSLTDCFFTAKNNNQDTINRMLNNSIKKLSGKTSVKEGWNAIFQNFNAKKTGTPSGYVTGETIFIKVNNGQAGWAINTADLSAREDKPIAETTPFTVLAMLTQLVDSCGIPQDKIYVGEPMTHLYKHLYDVLHAKYPNVKYLDKDNKTSLGRTRISGWHNDAIYYSDGGSDMPDAISDALCNEMYNANYMINMAALKAHARGGVTLCAKLHFGSHGNHKVGGWGSFHLHNGLVATVDNDVLDQGVRGDYGMYRVLTDLIGHEKLGGNTVLFLVDGLWGGVEATDRGYKWKSVPFSNDWPNSLFVSQDEVALESVCLDFLRAEAKVNTVFKNRPFFPAVDDYLHQAADKKNWAKGIIYDPEGDGTEMPSSLGVHEHWNNATDKQYSRNLGTGSGIELISYKSVLTSNQPVIQVSGFKSYPNPFTESIRIDAVTDQALALNIYTVSGQQVFASKMNGTYNWNGTSQNGSKLPKGTYLIKLTEKNSGKLVWTEKVICNR
jgi:hypothetical protein